MMTRTEFILLLAIAIMECSSYRDDYKQPSEPVKIGEFAHDEAFR